MSNPTTPFGWQMPENTDLVTDLPADFEVFGQAVATDLQYLLGGTTGQVLAKASATDLDFVWSADAAGMTNPMTTTGDSIYSSSGSTPARLGIGSAGQVLTVASGLPSWAAPASGGMTLISTTALSGASVSLASIPQTYNNLQLIMTDFAPSTGAIFRIQFNSETGSVYGWAKMRSTNTAIANNNNISTIDISDGIDGQTTGDQDSLLVMDIPAYTLAVDHNYQIGVNYYTGTETVYVTIAGVSRPSTAVAISSIQILVSAGTMSGTALLYGVK